MLCYLFHFRTHFCSQTSCNTKAQPKPKPAHTFELQTGTMSSTTARTSTMTVRCHSDCRRQSVSSPHVDCDIQELRISGLSDELGKKTNKKRKRTLSGHATSCDCDHPDVIDERLPFNDIKFESDSSGSAASTAVVTNHAAVATTAGSVRSQLRSQSTST